MLNWHRILTEHLLPIIASNEYWTNLISQIISDELSPNGLHLAVLVEPYLQYILDGKKTVESRFGIRRTTPYGKVFKGDVILLKRSGGPVMGLCQVSEVWSYKLDPDSWQFLRKEFTQSLCAQDPKFWEQRRSASYATLLRISSVLSIEPLPFPKQDRRGWVVLRTAFVDRLGCEVLH